MSAESSWLATPSSSPPSLLSSRLPGRLTVERGSPRCLQLRFSLLPLQGRHFWTDDPFKDLLLLSTCNMCVSRCKRAPRQQRDLCPALCEQQRCPPRPTPWPPLQPWSVPRPALHPPPWAHADWALLSWRPPFGSLSGPPSHDLSLPVSP